MNKQQGVVWTLFSPLLLSDLLTVQCTQNEVTCSLAISNCTHFSCYSVNSTITGKQAGIIEA